MKKQIGLLIVLLMCGCKSSHNSTTEQLKTNVELDAHTVPSGLLGHPVGTYLTIEGVAGQTKGGIRVLVEAVNGQSLSSEIYIQVNSIYVTQKTRCKIKGYETGGMVGEPPALKQLAPNRNIRFQQSQWQFWRYFVPMSIEYPEELSSQLTKMKDSPQSTGE